MIKRRRVLSILAGVVALPIIGVKAASNTKQWRGIALGAEAQIILEHENADVLIEQAVSEIKRLENIFSLYKTNSELSTLNREGELKNPSFEMLELLSLCSQINHKTNGAFDPSVQTLWMLYAEQYSKGEQVSEQQLKKARNITGWKYVNYSGTKINFAKNGMALTLNGVAQGYIADKISQLFKRNGISNVLINTGEIIALGKSPKNENWQVKIKNNKNPISLNNMAIATSAPLGTVFDKGGKISHIIDPRTGKPDGKWQQVSVIAKSAAFADGLSTGFTLMNEEQIIKAKGEAEVLLI